MSTTPTVKILAGMIASKFDRKFYDDMNVFVEAAAYGDTVQLDFSNLEGPVVSFDISVALAEPTEDTPAD